jgi:hypothetical protein
MKKKTSHGHVSLPPLRLYREDLLELYQLLSHDGIDKTTIETELYEFDTLQEYVENALVPPKELVLRNREKDITVFLLREKERSSIMWWDKGDSSVFGVVKVIEEFLLKRTDPVGRAFSKLDFPLKVVSGFAVSWGYFLNMRALLVFGGLLIALSLLYIVHPRPTTVLNGKRSERTNFFQRKKDDLILTLVQIVLAGAVGYLFGQSAG